MKNILIILFVLSCSIRLMLHGLEQFYYDSVKITVIKPFCDPFEIRIYGERFIGKDGEEKSYCFSRVKIYEIEYPYKYDVGEVIEEKFSFLSEVEFVQVMEVLSGLDLWKFYRSYPSDYRPIDGTKFMLEFSSSGVIARVSFHSPEQREWWPDLARLVDLMVKLSGAPVCEEKNKSNSTGDMLEAEKESNAEP